MSLFGASCVRCGSRTRHLYLERPACARCAHELELAVAAAGEARRACPVDGAELAKEIVSGTITDRCPSCRGTWLDAGELDRLTGEAAREAVLATGGGLRPPV